MNRQWQALLTEVTYRTSRSSGKGGQHVNKTETRVELLFPLAESQLLDAIQKQRIRGYCPNRIDQDGVLHVVSEESRSQLTNKEFAQQRFLVLIDEALRPRKKRVPTKPSKASKEKRIQAKKARSETKQRRRKGSW